MRASQIKAGARYVERRKPLNLARIMTVRERAPARKGNLSWWFVQYQSGHFDEVPSSRFFCTEEEFEAKAKRDWLNVREVIGGALASSMASSVDDSWPPARVTMMSLDLGADALRELADHLDEGTKVRVQFRLGQIAGHAYLDLED